MNSKSLVIEGVTLESNEFGYFQLSEIQKVLGVDKKREVAKWMSNKGDGRWFLRFIRSHTNVTFRQQCRKLNPKMGRWSKRTLMSVVSIKG